MNRDFIQIDGSGDWGGGLMIRTSIIFSALTGYPVRLMNIRAKRSNPGLRETHIALIKTVAKLAQARMTGIKIGSKKLEFYPGKLQGGNYKFDLGTVGSISLFLQAILPLTLFAPEETDIKFTGLTDVTWSPPVDYIIHVTIPILQKMGVPPTQIQIKQRGHRPKGGGQVEVKIKPVESLTDLKLIKRGEIVSIQGIAYCVKLPTHIAQRQAEAASKHLRKWHYAPVQIEQETTPKDADPHLSQGTGIVLWARTENSVLGTNNLGIKGKRAEIIGQEIAQKLHTILNSGCALDPYMSDMIIPYLALAKGSSKVSVFKITTRQLFIIKLIKKFLENRKFDIEGDLESKGVISVK